MNSLTDLTPGQLRQAADLQERIQALQSQLSRLLGAPAPAAAPATGNHQSRRRISAAGLARIAAAARARWARERAKKGAAPKAAAKTGSQRKMSPAARARLSAIAKARWQKAKSSGKAHL